MDREADNVTEMNLGRQFHHSVAGSWVREVNVDPFLRERGPAGKTVRLVAEDDGEVAASSGISIGRVATASLL